MNISTCFYSSVQKIVQLTEKRVMVSGVEGTAKQLVLMLRALKHLQEGGTVLLLSFWHGSDTATSLLYKQVLIQL
jgi:hypothetical protein